MAKLFRLDEVPEGFHYNYGTTSEAYNLQQRVDELEVEAAFYWYISGSYEGTGEVIMLKDKAWYLCSLSHCSCYGPTEHVNLDGAAYHNFEELLSACTNEYKKLVNPLIQLIKDHGYGPEPNTDPLNLGDYF